MAVRVNNTTSTGPLAVSGRLGGQGATVAGRLNDIDPNDIESIEVIKGPAAATIYERRPQTVSSRSSPSAARRERGPLVNLQVEMGSMSFANATTDVPTNYFKVPATGVIVPWNGFKQEADSGRRHL
jgi:hypothetical protein